MEHEFWHERWQDGRLGFHQPSGNPLLARHFDALGLAPGAHVFVPLCGKTGDIAWLLAKGCRVSGIELSEIAIKDLFKDLDVQPEISEHGNLLKYHAPGLDIFVGDVFKLTDEHIPNLDLVYDRAALVALPERMRNDYVPHIATITGRAPQMLITFDYNQSVMAGPPFSVPKPAIDMLYADSFDIIVLEDLAVEGGLKGIAEAREILLDLTPREQS